MHSNWIRLKNYFSTGSLYVFSIPEQKLLHEVVVPSFANSGITQCRFLPRHWNATHNATPPLTAVILSGHGHIVLVDIMAGKFIGRLRGRRNLAKSFEISQDGIFLSVHLLTYPGRIIVWSVKSLLMAPDEALMMETPQTASPAEPADQDATHANSSVLEKLHVDRRTLIGTEEDEEMRKKMKKRLPADTLRELIALKVSNFQEFVQVAS